MTDWGHVAEMAVTAAVGSLPVMLYIWSNKRKAREDTERRHQENQSLLLGMSTRERYYPHHKHLERTGNLTTEGIDYPPVNGKEK